MAYFNGRQIVFSPQVNINGDILPDFFVKNNDTLSGLFFNDGYVFDESFFEGLTYDEEIEVGGITISNVASLGFNLYAAEGDESGYYIFAIGTSELMTVIYATAAGVISGITAAGWQVNSVAFTSSITADFSTANGDFLDIKNNIVTKQEIGFGTSENETYEQLINEEWGSNS